MAVTLNNPEARIYVRGDQALAYGRVMEVMGEIAAAGFTKVSLIAEMPKGGSPVNPIKAKATQTSAPNVPTLQHLVPQPKAQPMAQGQINRAPVTKPTPPSGGARTPKMAPDQYPTGMLQHPPKR